MKKIAIVTGANNGLGYETTLALTNEGYKVIMACRNLEKAEIAKQKILNSIPNADLEIMQIDLGDLSSIRNFSSRYLEKYNQIDLLINNAGVLEIKMKYTKDHLESNIGINYFGHFLLTNLLFDCIKNTANSRIVSLGSIAHKQVKKLFTKVEELDPKYYSAYAQSKLACLMFSYELQRRIDTANYQTLSVASHPGVSITSIGRELPNFILKLQDYFGSFFFSDSKTGAEASIYAAINKDVKGGDYFGPNGFREIKGKVVKVGSSKLSKNQEKAKELWLLSEKITGEKFLV